MRRDIPACDRIGRHVASALTHSEASAPRNIAAPSMRKVRTWITRSKVGRYLVCGATTAGFNLALLALAIEGLRIDTGLGRNAANLVCTEISVLFSFFVYKIFVWRDCRRTARELIVHQVPVYHASVATAFLARTFLVFPLLDVMGVHYSINLITGIAIGAIISFIINDRVVFGGERVVVTDVGATDGCR